MAFLFKTAPKARKPLELVEVVNVRLRSAHNSPGDEYISAQRGGLASDDASAPGGAASDEVARAITGIKMVLLGDNETVPDSVNAEEICDAVFASDFVELLVRSLGFLNFEARKDAAHIFKVLMQRVRDGRRPGVDYILARTQLLFALVRGYDAAETGLTSGSMLRECIKHEVLAKQVLYSEDFYIFFRYVELPNFDLASDAFVVFRELLTAHKAACAEFLDSNYDRVFGAYTMLLCSTNYVTRRQSLKLLGELLLDRKNFKIRTRYIASEENLKLVMNLLRDKSKSIQFEAFHVFKVFVANPKKPETVRKIIGLNKEKLVLYFTNFQNDRDDDQFQQEKAFLIREVGKVEAPP